MKKLLITCGIRGSGNHLWANIFRSSPKIAGWDALALDKENYYLSHSTEPFIDYWAGKEIDPSIFDGHEFWSTNVSLPAHPSDSGDTKIVIPDVLDFADRVAAAGIEPIIAIITRDQNICKLQQLRLKNRELVDAVKFEIGEIMQNSKHPVHILSTETFFLFGKDYLNILSKELGFPIDSDVKVVDTNEKYIQRVSSGYNDPKRPGGVSLTEPEMRYL